jgi:hypothetical protein
MSPHGTAILITLGIVFFVFLCAAVPAFLLMSLSKFPLLTTIAGSTRPAFLEMLRLLLVITVFGMMMGWLNEFARRNNLPAGGGAIWLLAGVAVVLIHELGHFAAAKAVGFHVTLFNVGPFVLERRDTKWGFRLDLTIMRQGALGAVAAGPHSHDNLRSNTLSIAIGGPLASLLFGFASLGVLLRAPHSEFSRFGYGFGLCGVLSLLAFLASLLPSRGFFMSDGMRMLTLIRGDADLRPRDWNKAWVASLIADGQAVPNLFSGYFLAYAHALDAGNVEQAGKYLDSAAANTDRLPMKGLGGLFYESAYFAARHRDDPAKAREYLDRAAGLSRIDTYAIPRCQAAVLFAENRFGEARRALEEAKSRLSLIGQTGDALAEYDLVRDLERQLTLRDGPGSDEHA